MATPTKKTVQSEEYSITSSISIFSYFSGTTAKAQWLVYTALTRHIVNRYIAILDILREGPWIPKQIGPTADTNEPQYIFVTSPNPHLTPLPLTACTPRYTLNSELPPSD